jgi:hypothetical protein
MPSYRTLALTLATTSWTLKPRHHLPNGSYAPTSEAIDTTGRIERIGAGDRATFRAT